MSLEEIRGMEYPGRFIVLGVNTRGENVVIYGITGRSPPSKSRRLIVCGNKSFIKVEPIDKTR